MKKKSIIALLLTIIMCLCLVGCGSSSNVDIIEDGQFVVTADQYREVLQKHLQEVVWPDDDLMFDPVELFSSSRFYRNNVEQPFSLYFYDNTSSDNYAEADDIPTSIMLQVMTNAASEWWDLWKQAYAVAMGDAAEITYDEALTIIEDTYYEMLKQDESSTTIEQNGVEFEFSLVGDVINMEIYP